MAVAAAYGAVGPRMGWWAALAQQGAALALVHLGLVRGQGAGLAEAGGHRLDAVGAVEVDVQQGVDDVEARHPKQREEP